MTAFSLAYAFTSGSLAAAVTDPLFASTNIAKSATMPAMSVVSNELVITPGVVGAGTLPQRAAKNVTFTVGPLDAGQTWVPGNLVFKHKRGTSTTSNGGAGWIVRTSADAFATNAGGGTTANTTYTTTTIDLSVLGTITGPLEIQFWPFASSTTTTVIYDDISLAGTYTYTPPADKNITATGIASAEAFGTASVAVEADLDITMTGIASAEAFGSMQVYQPPTQDLALVGIASLEAFGIPSIGPAAHSPVLPYPTGQEVADYLGQGDNDALVLLAEQHVSIISGMARIYCRGRGFYAEGVSPELQQVILVATGRLVANPEQIQQWVGTIFIAEGFKGWSLAEQVVLNQYRSRSR